MTTQTTKAGQRAADSLAAHILNVTATGYGAERPDVLRLVALHLNQRATELEQARATGDD